MARSHFWGFTVQRHTVSVHNPHAQDLSSLLDEAESILTGAGYLVVRGWTYINAKAGNWLDVYRAVTTEEHARKFLRSSYACKVVTKSGEMIDARDDPGVRAELAAEEAAAEEREAARQAAEEAARARQDDVVGRLHAAGVESARATWRDATRVTISVEDAERMLGVLEMSQPRRTVAT
jgi:hypothetical protein